MWVVGWITLHATLAYTTVNTFNVSLIEYRERIDSLSALQHPDSTDRASQSPRAAADLYTNKTQQQPAGRPRVLLFHRCLGSGGGGGGWDLCLVCVCAENTWKYRCWQITQCHLVLLYFQRTSCRSGNSTAPFSGFSSETGRAVSSLPLLASLYLFAHPRDHLFALRCIANSSSVSTGHKAALWTAGTPEVYCVQSPASFSLHLGSTLVHCYSKYALCVYTLFHLIGDGV